MSGHWRAAASWHRVHAHLVEAQRFINVPMGWREEYPARERRELWMTPADGDDVKLVVHTRVMPARRGHRISGVLQVEQLVGLTLTTAQGANFVRSAPPLLRRRCDSATQALTLASLGPADVGAFSGGWPLIGALGLVAALTYVPLLILGGLMTRRSLANAVDNAIESAKRQKIGQPRVRRVK